MQMDKVEIKISMLPEQEERYKNLAESKGLNLTQLILHLLEKEEQDAEDLQKFTMMVEKIKNNAKK